MKKLIFILFLFIAGIPAFTQKVSINGNKFYVGSNEIWFNGINTPWHLFDDFGRQDFNPEWWEAEFQKYVDNKINLARVWIHGSGEISPTISSDGTVTGASTLFWEHMDILFQIAAEKKVYILPCLFSFDITKNSYPTYQRWRDFLNSSTKVQSYITNVLIPLVQRYDGEPYLLGWEICNEPEWMFENSEHGPQTLAAVQRLHSMCAAAIHRNCSDLVTTGSAAPKWNSPIYDSWGDREGNCWSDEALRAINNDAEAYLDFYQYHWYAWQTEWLDSPYTMTTEEYQVDDRPVLVGETEGNNVCDNFICQTLVEMYENAYLNGFDGVCAWKTPQNDGHGTFENISVATKAFHSNHPSLVYPGGSQPIPVTGVSVSPTSASVAVNGTRQLTATVAPANATNKTVTWTSSGTAIATVSSSGLVTGRAAGSAVITVRTQDGGFTATSTITVTTVTIPVTGVSVTPTSASVEVNGTQQLTATVAPANATNKTVTWTSSGTAIATVSSSGLVTGRATGSATITVTTADGGFTATSTITVSDGEITPCDNPVSVSLPKVQNGTGEFCWVTSGNITYVNSWNMTTVEINGVDFTNKWSNSMPARIDGNYYIYYRSTVGWAHLEVNGTDGGNVPVTGVSVTPTTASVNVNGTQQLTATVAPANATNKAVTWTSSSTAIATVSSSGLVTGRAAGSAVVTARTQDGGFTATSTITVTTANVPVTGVSVTPTTASVNVNGTQQLTATVAPANATNKTVTWTSSSTAIATVSSSGLVTGRAAGSAVITVRTQDGGFTATCAVTVEDGGQQGCDNPVAINIPFVQNGAGEYCWVTTTAMAYINSWALTELTVNGVDFTNIWSNNLPPAQNGQWEIHYVGNYGWSHFEAPAAKDAETISSTEDDILVYPNPFKDELYIDLNDFEGVKGIELINPLGQLVMILNEEQIEKENVIVVSELQHGLFILKIYDGESIITRSLIKQ